MPRTLMILDPGHFHAALPLRSMSPRLAPEVHVFAPEGPELERFLAMVERFNTRAHEPTAWKLNVRRCADPLAALLSERPGDVAVLAGRNCGKLARIAALVRAGVHVLADKPWVVEATDIAHVHAIAGEPAHYADLMTERFEPLAVLFADLAQQPALVGDADTSRGPVIVKETVHHLAKLVDGAPLVRPPWYFDVTQQGEGLTDVTTHYVDQVLLIAQAAQQPLTPGEVRLVRAQRWTTAVPAEDYTAITGTPAFPSAVTGAVRDGVLHLAANGELEFTCRGLSARIRAEWRLRAADAAGDFHRARFHGTRADLELDGSASAGSRLRIRPRGDAAALRAALTAWAAGHPGVMLEDEPDAVTVRPARISGHEEHFAAVLDHFLVQIDHGPQPAWERAALNERYRLLAEAKVRAVGYSRSDGLERSHTRGDMP